MWHISAICRDTSCRRAGKWTCEKWACPKCLYDTLLAPMLRMMKPRCNFWSKKKEKGSGLTRRRLQGEMCLNEQMAKTQRCLLLLLIIKQDKITTVGSLTNGRVITYMVHTWKAAAGWFMSGIEIGCSLSSRFQWILKGPSFGKCFQLCQEHQSTHFEQNLTVWWSL